MFPETDLVIYEVGRFDDYSFDLVNKVIVEQES